MFQGIFRFFREHHGIWTAIFTGMLTLFTYKLYQVATVTNETARATQRAFVTLGGIGVGPEFNGTDGKRVAQEFAITWTNTGTTPATSAILQGNSKPFIEGLPKGYEFELLPEKTHTVFAPKGTSQVNIAIPWAILVDAWHGRSRLFIWGTAIYKDIFPGDPERLSEFCIELTHLTAGYKIPPKVPAGKPAPTASFDDANSMIVGYQWQACNIDTHSCYDEDCKDYADRVKDMRP